MRIDFKYKIQEINYKEGFVTVDYLITDQPNTTVTVNHLIPTIDDSDRYISGLDLEQFIVNNFPIHAFGVEVSSNNNSALNESIEYDNTQLKFEGEGVFDTDSQNQENIPDNAIPDFELEEYTKDINDNYSTGSTAEYLRARRVILKVLEELNIIK